METQSTRAKTWLAPVVGAIVMIALGWHRLYGQSVDLGLHYALTNELFSILSAEGVTAQHLGIMAQYPRGAHWTAGVLSLITHSPLVSIIVLTELAAYGAYFVIALFLIEDGWLPTSIKLGAMLMATWFLGAQQAAFGDQVVINFFFPQVLGESVVLIALYLLSGNRFWALRRRTQFVALFVTVWLLMYFQPLAAVELGGAVITFSIISMFVRVPLRIEGTSGGIAGPATLSMAVLLAIALHPALETMMSIAAHDGYLRFGDLLPSGGYLWLVAFGALASVAALYGAHREMLPGRRALILASATLSSALLLCAQRLLLSFFNIGSEYGVSKYVFLLSTIAATTMVYASVGIAASVKARSLVRQGSVSSTGIVAATFSLSALYMVITHASPWEQDVRPVLEYERYASHFMRYSVPLDGVGNIVSLNKLFDPTINFLVSLGDLKLPLELSYLSLSAKQVLHEWPVKYAMISSKWVDPVVLASCAAGAGITPQYAVVKRECFAKLLTFIAPGRSMKTSADEPGVIYLTSGWASPEFWGTWSVGEVARLDLTLPLEPQTARYSLHINYIAFIVDGKREQRFTVFADGVPAGSYQVSDTATKEIVVPLSRGGHHTVEINIDSPRSPKELKLSDIDTRRLGFGIAEINVERTN